MIILLFYYMILSIAISMYLWRSAFGVHLIGMKPPRQIILFGCMLVFWPIVLSFLIIDFFCISYLSRH